MIEVLSAVNRGEGNTTVMKGYGKRIFAIGILLATAVPALAGDLTIVVRDQSGAPVADAIVTLSAKSPAKDAAPAITIVDQKAEQFQSLVSLLRPGDRLRFHNSDPMLHHVYSFAPINPFDRLVRPGETTPETLYAAVGLAAIGCNVHDNMLTYVYVTDLPFAGKTDANGGLKILNAPQGETELSVWHSRATAKDQTETSTIVVADSDQSIDIGIGLRPERRRRPVRY